MSEREARLMAQLAELQAKHDALVARMNLQGLRQALAKLNGEGK